MLLNSFVQNHVILFAANYEEVRNLNFLKPGNQVIRLGEIPQGRIKENGPGCILPGKPIAKISAK